MERRRAVLVEYPAIHDAFSVNCEQPSAALMLQREEEVPLSLAAHSQRQGLARTPRIEPVARDNPANLLRARNQDPPQVFHKRRKSLRSNRRRIPCYASSLCPPRSWLWLAALPSLRREQSGIHRPAARSPRHRRFRRCIGSPPIFIRRMFMQTTPKRLASSPISSTITAGRSRPRSLASAVSGRRQEGRGRSFQGPKGCVARRQGLAGSQSNQRGAQGGSGL